MNGNKKKNAGGIVKRFIGNKNTVTILGILACVATLIIGYNYRVRVAIDPISVPYAKQGIPTRTLITSNMVGKIKISKSYTKNAGNLVISEKNVVNKYVSFKTSIPKNSLFYKEQLIDAEEMPDHVFSNIPDGTTIFSLDVSTKNTYYNSVRAGDYIDLYVRANDKDDENKVIYAKLIESIRVLAVKDNKGNNIIKNRMENGKPSELLFAVPDDMFLLLKKAEYVDLKVQIEPVLRNAQYTKDANETQVKSDELREFILERCEEL